MVYNVVNDTIFTARCFLPEQLKGPYEVSLYLLTKE